MKLARGGDPSRLSQFLPPGLDPASEAKLIEVMAVEARSFGSGFWIFALVFQDVCHVNRGQRSEHHRFRRELKQLQRNRLIIKEEHPHFKGRIH